jgi:hypothetical protein
MSGPVTDIRYHLERIPGASDDCGASPLILCPPVRMVARILGRSRSQIYRILKEHGVDPTEFRSSSPSTTQS